jgi:hypothetical protein
MEFFDFMNKEPIKESEKLYASSRSFQKAGTKIADGRYVSADELYSFIADFLSKPLEAYGFKYLKSKKAFKRTTTTGCDEIIIWFVDHVHYEVNFTFAKRVDKLQKIITTVNYELGFNTISNYKEHRAIWISYSNIIQNNIEIVSYLVLDKELPKVLELIKNEIIPYFDKLNNVDFVNQTLNYPQKDEKNHFSFFSLNGFDNALISGLIVARILDDPNYGDLINTHTTKYSQNIVLKKKAIKLYEYLKHKEISLI